MSRTSRIFRAIRRSGPPCGSLLRACLLAGLLASSGQALAAGAPIRTSGGTLSGASIGTPADAAADAPAQPSSSPAAGAADGSAAGVAVPANRAAPGSPAPPGARPAQAEPAAGASAGAAASGEAGDPASGWWADIRNDNAAAVRAALAAGADPNARNARGQPALMQAVRDGAWQVYDVLAADRRTDVNILNPAQETPLMYVSLVGQHDRAQALIARGAQVNRLGWTPLHYAAAKGHDDVARLLLSHGAMPNAPAPDGASPLMMAVRANSAQTVQLLIHAGADPGARNLAGQDAVDVARASGNDQLAQALEKLMRERRARQDGKRP